ncbi:hypothetical protein M9458_053397, partial [Cirrhinus mrigala]
MRRRFVLPELVCYVLFGGSPCVWIFRSVRFQGWWNTLRKKGTVLSLGRYPK